MSRKHTAFSLAALALLLTGDLLYAGPLNPPAGPIASTNKTITEVEPRTAINAANTPGDADSLFKITQPGSYYLTGNITGVVGRHGIEIAASGVTIDMMGFDLVGVPAMGAFDGVSVTLGGLTNITVRNGSVRAWGDEGVDLGSFVAVNSAVVDVRASGNAGNCILASAGSTITGCLAHLNTSNGISAATGSTITGCSAYNNTNNGISVNAGSTITSCTAYSNGGGGISCGSGCAISGCAANLNTGSGFLTDSGCSISACSAYDNTGSGFITFFGSTVTNCAARLNSINGFSIGSGSTITGCSAQSNTLDGILVSGESTIRGNRCDSNGVGAGIGAGIHATFGDNLIEGNTCTRADRGIDVDFAGNIIIKNTCSGNSTANWDIVANNVCGPILDRTAPASAAILGNAAVDSTGSTHPNANFSY